MPRKRQRMRRDPHTFQDGMNQGHHPTPPTPMGVMVDGKLVHVRRLNPSDEGVLYTMQISTRRKRGSVKKASDSASGGSSWGWWRWWSDWKVGRRRNNKKKGEGPETNTLWGQRSFRLGAKDTQFTIRKKKKYNNRILNWIDSQNLNPFPTFHDVDTHLYRPSNLLYRYIDWTFHVGFTAVFLTFLIIYFSITIFFGVLLLAAGIAQPECITTGGAHFGTNPYTLFNDAFHLSWTTFTTVGYGNGYTSTANDLVSAGDGTTKAQECSGVVFLCNSAAFIGLLYAGMCGAILFGKVNRVQSHAKLIFSNAVCLQYEEIEEEDYEDAETDRDVVGGLQNGGMKDGMEVRMVEPQSPTEDDDDEDDDDENMKAEEGMLVQTPSKAEQFMDQYNGCPVLKFQVVNEMCNREGSEIVDAIMKVIGIKFKGRDGQVTHSQYVRVNLVDFEHPFFSRVWHGVHILNANSPLLTEKAKQRINENKGSWPPEWFNPETIKKKLEFNDLVVTVAGISNVSAVTVHAYKRYKIGDVLIGFNFAPLVFRDEITGKLEVDMSLCHDVREQRGGGCEDLMVPENRYKRAESTIRIVKSRDSDFLDSLQHNESQGIDRSFSEDGSDNP